MTLEQSNKIINLCRQYNTDNNTTCYSCKGNCYYGLYLDIELQQAESSAPIKNTPEEYIERFGEAFDSLLIEFDIKLYIFEYDKKSKTISKTTMETHSINDFISFEPVYSLGNEYLQLLFEEQVIETDDKYMMLSLVDDATIFSERLYNYVLKDIKYHSSIISELATTLEDFKSNIITFISNH